MPSDIAANLVLRPSELDGELDGFARKVHDAGIDGLTAFDIDPDNFVVEWPAHVRRSAGVIRCIRGGDLVGIIWGRNFPGCLVADCHAVFLPGVSREVRVAFVRQGLALVATFTRLKSVLAIVPTPYRHVRALAVECGFRELGNVPGLVPMRRRENPVSGTILVYELDHVFNDGGRTC